MVQINEKNYFIEITPAHESQAVAQTKVIKQGIGNAMP